MGGGCGPNCTTFTLNVPLSSLSEVELESIRKSIIELLQGLGAGKVTVSFREGSTKAYASTKFPVNEETLNGKVTEAGDIQTLGDSKFIIAKINGTPMEYNNKLIIVKTDNTIAYIDDVGDHEVVLRSDWDNATSGIEKDEIKHVTFGKSVKYLGRNVFDGTPENNVFENCNNLETVTLSPQIVTIWGFVFQNCTSIKSFYITVGVNSIIELASGAAVPSVVFRGCASLESYDVDEENQRFSSLDGVLFSKDKTTLEAFPLGSPKTEYTVPEGVTAIEGSAFLDCTSLVSITLPFGLIRVMSRAFEGCTSLTSIIIPKSVNSFGIYGNHFENCTALATVTFEDERVEDVKLDNAMFKGCVALAAIDLPEKVLFDISDGDANEIATSVFEGCTSLAKVTVRDPSVVEYLDGAFKDVPAVKAGSLNFNVANALEEIEFGADNEAFSGLSTAEGDGLRFGADDSGGEGLKKVLLSDPLIKYFQLNVPLSSLNETERNSIKVSVGNLLSTLGGGAVTVDILPYPDSVGLTLVKATTTNEVEAAPLAEKVTKAGAIQTLGNSKFIIAKINGTPTEYNNKLIIVKTDNDIAYIDYNVGEAGIVKRSDWEDSGINENQIKHVAFGKDVTEVSLGFFGCTSLATITFPVSVILAPYVFSGCTSLISVFLTAGVESSGITISGVFYGCTSVLAYTADRESPRYSSVEGVLFSKDKTKLELFPLGDTRTEYTVPEGVTTIMPDAFIGSTSLVSITLPAGVTTIGRAAFSVCTSLASIILPEGLTSIGEKAFLGCAALASITIPKSVTLFGESGLIFKNCVKLETVTFEGGRQDDVELPFEMFSGCETLAAIDLPEKVLFDIAGVRVDEKATSIFDGCTSLAKVTVRDPRVTEYLDSAFNGVPAVQTDTLDFNVANALAQIEFGADNGAFSDKSTELDPPNKLYFGADGSGGDGLKKVLLTPP